jgi:outer membrane protein assembly factor BamB
MRSSVRRAALCLAMTSSLAGCDLFFGEDEGPPLPGERISVLRLNRSLVADPAISDLRVRLPRPYENSEWPQTGGFAGHAMHHLAAPDALTAAWTADVGDAAGDDAVIIAQPVVSDGRLFAMDAGATVSARDAGSGAAIWQVDLTPDEERDGLFGGGLAIDEGRLFVTTPFGLVFALDPATGAELWRTRLPTPVRTAPTASGGRVFAITLDNQLFALAADDGRRLWSYSGVIEDAGLLGGAAPAVVGSTVIVGFSSGELTALKAETGRVLWGDNLAGVARGDAIATLADIRGLPVADRDRLIAVSNSGNMAAFDINRGGRVWTAAIASNQTPWVAGDFIFVISTDAEIICLTRDDGRVRWIQALPRYADEADQEDPIHWSGPVLVGDRLIVNGSNGEAFSVSPYTGEILGVIRLPARSFVAPAVANNTVYILSDDAVLTALR